MSREVSRKETVVFGLVRGVRPSPKRHSPVPTSSLTASDAARSAAETVARLETAEKRRRRGFQVRLSTRRPDRCHLPRPGWDVDLNLQVGASERFRSLIIDFLLCLPYVSGVSYRRQALSRAADTAGAGTRGQAHLLCRPDAGEFAGPKNVGAAGSKAALPGPRASLRSPHGASAARRATGSLQTRARRCFPSSC